MFHAIGLAIARFRKCDVPCRPEPNAMFTVEPQEAPVQHKVPREKFEAWLAKEGVSSPAQTFQRNMIRELLRDDDEPSEKRKRQPYH